ncbi:hypothetical protein C4556_01685 [Candidatus Parcubacteria bacterium]|nr:MAG: hypothetical protein C4556_01685 [Candidatus Parcubacteria bacterium]
MFGTAIFLLTIVSLGSGIPLMEHYPLDVRAGAGIAWGAANTALGGAMYAIFRPQKGVFHRNGDDRTKEGRTR